MEKWTADVGCLTPGRASDTFRFHGNRYGFSTRTGWPAIQPLTASSALR